MKNSMPHALATSSTIAAFDRQNHASGGCVSLSAARRFAHARKAAQEEIPRLRSGFRLRGSRFAHARKTAQLNKTFCLLFTQKGCLFEMIIRTYLS
jgi:hypothetical protein